MNRENPSVLAHFHQHDKDAWTVDKKGDSHDVNARKKLNSVNITGVLIIATMVGAAAGSWWAFGGTAIVLFGLSLHDGSIRPKPMKRKR